jgi:1,4-alpha-glucan branching enzyme
MCHLIFVVSASIFGAVRNLKSILPAVLFLLVSSFAVTAQASVTFTFEGYTANLNDEGDPDGSYDNPDGDYPAYGGAGTGLVSVDQEDGSSSAMLRFENGAGASWWSGFTLAAEYSDSDFIGDGTTPVTMTVLADQEGTIRLELQADGQTAFTQSVAVVGGWNSLSFDLSGVDASINWHTIQIRPDAQGETDNGDTIRYYYFDNIAFPDATIVDAPALVNPETVEFSAGGVTPSVDASEVFSLYSDAYDTADSDSLLNNYDITTWSAPNNSQTEMDIDNGNEIKRFGDAEYVGYDFTSFPVEAYENFSLSLFRQDTSDFLIKLVDTNATDENGNPTNITAVYTIPADQMVAGQWSTIDIPMTNFAPSVTKINQIVIEPLLGGVDGATETFYLDDMYFHGARTVSATISLAGQGDSFVYVNSDLWGWSTDFADAESLWTSNPVYSDVDDLWTWTYTVLAGSSFEYQWYAYAQDGSGGLEALSSLEEGSCAPDYITSDYNARVYVEGAGPDIFGECLSIDTDGDGISDAIDTDDDNDGVEDVNDWDPLDANFSSKDWEVAAFQESFGGVTLTGSAVDGDGPMYTFPASTADAVVESWAGFANLHTQVYPLFFTSAGSVTFNASVPSGGSVDVRFRFEKNPHPDVNPSYNTEAVTVTGADVASYTIPVPSQGANQFKSFLMYLDDRDVGVIITDVVVDSDPESGGYDPTAGVVTFSVDMSGVDLGGNTPNVVGDFNGYCGGQCAPMADPDGDGVWTLDITLAAINVGNSYLFALGDTQETLTNNNGDRVHCATVTPDGPILEDGSQNELVNRTLQFEGDTVLETVPFNGCAGAAPVDSDGDGVADDADAFPNDATETADTDSDGTGDNADAFPNDASETADTDGDGVGDNADYAPNDPNVTDAPTVPATPTGGLVLDFENMVDAGAYPAYGGVGASIGQKAEVDGVTVRNMLVLDNGAGAEWWSGVTIVSEYVDSDLIGDGSAPVTMRVFADQDGNLNFELEADGQTPVIINKAVVAGWNSLSFDVSAHADINWHKAQIRPDALGQASNAAATRYYIDDVHFANATIVAAPAPTNPTSAAFLAGAATPAETDVVSLFSDAYSSALNNVSIASWSDPNTAHSEMSIDNGNTIKKFDQTVFAGFDVPVDFSIDGKTTLSVSLYRQASSDFEVKLVDLSSGTVDMIYVIPAADMPVDQWSTVDVALSDFTGSITNVDQLVIKPMGGAEVFYLDDMYFHGTAAVVVDSDGDGVADDADAFPNDATESVDADGDGVGANADYDDNDASVQNAPAVTTTDYCSTEVTHFNIDNHPGSILVTIENSGADSVDVTATSVADVIDLLIIENVDGGGTASATDITGGVATSTISWAAGTMPATVSFGMLWSDEAAGGNQMLNKGDGTDALGNIDTAFDCATDHPVPSAPVAPSTVNVTFQVDMSAETVDATGVYVAGGALFANAGQAMSDDDNDGIWTLTVAIDANSTVAYKFRNRASTGDGDWAGFEEEDGIIAGGCGTGQYNDRFVTVTDQDVVLDVVAYGSCTDTPYVAPVVDADADGVDADTDYDDNNPTVQTAPAQISLVLTTDGSAVRLTGPWWNWADDGGPEATDNSDGTWTITMDTPTENMEYLWVVDGVRENLIDNAAAPASECGAEVADGSLVTDYWSYGNRVWVYGSYDVADTYDACAGTPAAPAPVDSDGDGVADDADAFPNDATETADTDSDGTGDNADAFPNDASETADTDGDGVGDNADYAPNDPNVTDAPTVPATPTGGLVLDFENMVDAGAYPAYGGVGASIGQKAEVDGVTVRNMLVLDNGAGAEWWSGVTIVSEYVDSDLIGDGSAPVTMRVFADQDGNLNFELEADGQTPVIINKAVVAGWNSLSFDVSAHADINWHKAQIRPDALGQASNAAATRYYIDDVHFANATIVAAPAPTNPTSAAFLAGAATPAETDVVSLFSDAYSSALNNVSIASWSDPNTAHSEMSIDNGNTIKKFDQTVFAGFDVPVDFSIDGKTTLSVSLYRQASSDFEVKLVDLSSGTVDMIYVIPAADMPVDQWSTVDVALSDFTGSITNVDQLVIKPMGGAEVFYLDDMYFHGTAAVVVDSDGDGVADDADAFPNDATESVDADGDGVGANADYDDNDASVQNAPAVTTTDYCSTEVTHFNIDNHPGSILVTIENSGADSVDVTATSVADVIDLLIIENVDGGGTASATDITGGVATSTISWAAGTMPATVSFGMLWSDEAAGGNQMLNKGDGTDALGNIDTAFDCATDHPVPSAPVAPSTVNVTFQVDMSAETVDATGVYVAGGALFANAGQAMSDDDNDGIWTLTVAIDANSTVAYKFRNRASTGDGDWAGFEEEDGIIAGGCGTGQYNDRFVTVTDQDVVLDVVAYGSCTDTPYVAPVVDADADGVDADTDYDDNNPTVQTAPAQISLVLTTDGSAVRLTGPWWNWADDGGPEATDNSDGTWTITMDTPTENMEYLWVVDGVRENLIDNAAAPASECGAEVADGSLVTDYWSYGNRVWVYGSYDVADTYDACAGTPAAPAPVDSDGDGVADDADAFPNDATETADTDSDGTGDNADAFPNDASETADTDGDGVGDNADYAPNDPNVTAAPTVPATPTGGLVLDFENMVDAGAYPAYGGVGASIGQKAEVDGVTVRNMLVLDNGAGAEWWSGVTIVSEYVDSDLIGDGSAPVTMRVFADQDGNLNFELEADGQTPVIINKAVVAGWNSLSFDVSAHADINWHKAQIRPDALGQASNAAATRYYIDDVHFANATIVAAPAPTNPTSAAFLAGAATPAETDVVSLFSDAYSSALNNVSIASWSDPNTAHSEMSIDNGNTIKKFDQTVFAGFDVPVDFSIDGKTTLSVSLYRQASSDFEVKLVDLSSGTVDMIYVIPAADMPVDQWSTVDVALSDFTGSITNVDQLVIKPMGGAEVFYLDDMYFHGTAAVVVDSDGDGVADDADAFPNDATESVDADGDGVGANADYDDNDASVQNAPAVTTTDYCSTEVTHFNIDNHPGSILVTIENSGADSVDVTATSVADVIDLLIIENVDGGGTASATDITGGVATSTISWAAGTMPATVSFGMLWSDEAAGGNQMLNKGDGTDALGNIDTAFDCATDHPVPSAPVAPSTVNVTFQVDMSAETVDATGVYVAGGALFANAGQAMSDDDNDGIWTLTVAIDANSTVAYKFRNRASTGDGDWAGFEEEDGIIAGGCGTGQYNDRFVTVTDQDVVLDVVAYGSCTDTPYVAPVVDADADGVDADTDYDDNNPTVQTAPAQISLVLTTDGSAVRLTGPWWNWADDGGPEATDNSDGTWTITMDTPTENMEYLWVVDGVRENLIDNAAAPASECGAEVADGSLVTDYWSYGNRVWVYGSYDVADTYDACAGTPAAPAPVDSDGDGVADDADAFPNDATETADTDSDGTGDNADAFPNDASETADTDSDGTGDNADAFPNDATETADTDSDGTGDNADAFPNDASETTDTDSDGTGDNADVFPNDATETTDTDSDGTGDNADAFPNDASETADTDGDGVGDNSDYAPNDPNVTDAPALPEQQVSVVGTPMGLVGSDVKVTVSYDASNGDDTVTGLGIRLHYDSSVLTFVSQSDVLAADNIGASGPYNDDDNDDSDTSTDKYVDGAWASFDGTWPGALPADLFTVTFTVNDVDSASTDINFSSTSTAVGYEFAPTSYSMNIIEGSFDFDGNGTHDALSDGLLFLRYAFEFTGTDVTDGVVANDSPMSDADILASLETAKGSFGDIDGNGVVDALTDGILLIRSLFGFSGDALISGAVGDSTTAGAVGDATRTTAAEIQTYIDSMSL